jgi:hypothetical protein
MFFMYQDTHIYEAPQRHCRLAKTACAQKLINER